MLHILSCQSLEGERARHPTTACRRRAHPVCERYPLIPLQNCLRTPELQWQPRGKRRTLQTPGPRLRNASFRLRNVSFRLRNLSFRLRNLSFDTGNAWGRLWGVPVERPGVPERRDSPVRRRFPWIPLQHWPFTPELQWQSRGKRRIQPLQFWLCAPELQWQSRGKRRVQPLQFWLFTPELQWQSRGKRRVQPL
jgi:hypothetical protein